MKNGTVLITGAAKRVGKSVAIELAKHGYDIAIHFNRSKTHAEELRQTIREFGVHCEIFPCDLTQTDDLQPMMNSVFSQFPDCNVLINNASVFERTSFTDTRLCDFNKNFSLHVKAPFFLSQAFAKHCTAGNIINMVDTKVYKTLTAYFAYTLSKKTLFEFTKMAAKDLAPNIRVNGIAPGYILPPIDGSDTDEDRVQNRIPLKRLGNPEWIAQTVLYILNNPFITGECITVDGGERLK